MEDMDRLLNEYESLGSNKESLKKIKEKLDAMLKGNPNIDKVLDSIIDELEVASKEFLDSKTGSVNNIEALSSMIYLQDPMGDYKIKLLGGKDNNGEEINNKTVFDIASITKLFTLILTFKLDEVGVISLDKKVVDYLPEYQGLEDFTINDLILLCGEIYTDGNVASADNKETAEKLLKTAYLKSNDRTKNKYTDFGAIIISKIIEKVVSEEMGRKTTYDEIMDKHLFKPFGLYNTTFHPKGSITGNGHIDTVHDPKARILGPVGSAGVFTNSEDLAKLARKIYRVDYTNYQALRDIISKSNLEKLGTITFPDSPFANRGYLGLYQKSDDPNRFFAPSVYADKTFTAQGWTGSLAIFDQQNKIHNSILVSSIAENPTDKEIYKNDKPIGYMSSIGEYEKILTMNTLLLQILKKYYKHTKIDVERHVR